MASSLNRILNTNSRVLTSLEGFRNSTLRVDTASNKLATGVRLHRSADDVPSYKLARLLETDTLTSRQALQNTQDGISLLQVAEGTLISVTDSLQRMRELAIQMANDTNGPEQRNAIAGELRQVAENIQRLSSAAEFNGKPLFDGSFTNARIQIGNGSANITNTLDVAAALQQVDLDSLNLTNGATSGGTVTDLDDIFDGTATVLDNSTTILEYIEDIDLALDRIGIQRSSIGAFENQLTRTLDFLDLNIVNIEGTRSRLEDTNFATETAELTQAQIIQQSALTLLAQANTTNQSTLQLLQQ